LNTLPHSETLELEMVPTLDGNSMMQANKCEVWFGARVPGFILPSFKSFAISRAYQLRVKLGIEIAGKKFEHDVESMIHGMGGGSG
ncbi:hypothetical protein GQ44DRAFT_622212, partial [Phaeosphaeriaceae sp. PMI808]